MAHLPRALLTGVIGLAGATAALTGVPLGFDAARLATGWGLPERPGVGTPGGGAPVTYAFKLRSVQDQWTCGAESESETRFELATGERWAVRCAQYGEVTSIRRYVDRDPAFRARILIPEGTAVPGIRAGVLKAKATLFQPVQQGGRARFTTFAYRFELPVAVTVTDAVQARAWGRSDLWAATAWRRQLFAAAAVLGLLAVVAARALGGREGADEGLMTALALIALALAIRLVGCVVAC